MSSDITDHDITEAMIVYGGSFVHTLGWLWRRADEDNQRRIKAAFPEHWTQYAAIAELRQIRTQA